MTLVRSTAGINKAVGAGRMDAGIWFDDALRLVFPTTVASFRILWLGPTGGLM